MCFPSYIIKLSALFVYFLIIFNSKSTEDEQLTSEHLCDCPKG